MVHACNVAGNVTYVFPGTVSVPILRCETIVLSWDYVIYQLKGNLLRGCFCVVGPTGVRLDAKNSAHELREGSTN